MPRAFDDVIMSLRRQLAAEIVRSLGEGSQHTIAPTFGIPQPRMSELNRGVVKRCTVEWLIRRIHRLGGSVQVTVTLGDARRAWIRDRAARMPSVRRPEAEARRPEARIPSDRLIPKLE